MEPAKHKKEKKDVFVNRNGDVSMATAVEVTAIDHNLLLISIGIKVLPYTRWLEFEQMMDDIEACMYLVDPESISHQIRE